MRDKDSEKIFESYAASRARLNEDVGTWTQTGQAMLANMRANAASGGGGGDTGYNHTGGMGETLPMPDAAQNQFDKDQVVKELVRREHGWDIDRNPTDGKWYRFDAGEARPVTGDEHWDIMRIEDPEREAEYKQKQNPGDSSEEPGHSVYE